MSLVAWWPLEGNAQDRLEAHDASPVGSPAYSSGKIGDCYDNTGGNNTGFELFQDAEFTPYEARYSFSLWFKSTTESGQGYARILSRDASEYPTIFIFQDQASPQVIEYSDQSGNSISTEVSVNGWHHLALTVDIGQNEVQIFIDGERIGTNGVSVSDLTRPYVLGYNTEGDGNVNGRHFEGKIDDVRLYDHVLSAKEVQQLSQAKVLHYKFDQPGAIDVTGNGNSGTLNGPTHTESSRVGSGAYDFDGSSYIITDTDAPSGDPEVTLSVWAKASTTDQTQWTGLLSLGTNQNNNTTFTINTEGNGNNIAVHTWTNSTPSVPLDDTNWHHYVGVNTGDGEQRFYVDGEFIGKMNQTLSIPSEPGVVGGRKYAVEDNNGRFWNGIIDDPRIYKEALSESEINELYEQRTSLDDTGTVHAHELDSGVQESFDRGSFGPRWSVSNATISSSRSYNGNYSFGSWNDGGLEATLELFGGEQRQIDSFEYVWQEDGSQTGHAVILYDQNGNEVQESGTENPQWYLNDGSGGRFSVSGYDGQGYNVWTRFRFDFDWDAGNYDYQMEDLDGNVYRSGTTALDNATGVAEVRFTGSGYGSADYCRFDQIKVNDTAISTSGTFNTASLNEVGPGADSLVGWWPLDGNLLDYSGGGNNGSNNGATITNGLGQSAYDFERDNTEYVDVGTLDDEFAFGSGDFTFSFWCNFESTGSYRTLFELSRYSHGILIRPDGGDLDIYVDNSSWKPSIGWDTGQWYHIVVTRTNGTVKLYIDTDSQGTASLSGSVSINQESYIGMSVHSSGQNFDGKIQDVRIYDRALTTDEVTQLYQLTDPRESTRTALAKDGSVYTKSQFNERL